MKSFLLLVSFAFSAHAADDLYRIGAGQFDITGPAAEMRMMGYVNLKQKTAGIATRLRARAFIVDDGKQRVAVVTSDLCHQTLDVTQAVMEKLKKKYGKLYTEKNTLLATTHTHSGPGGYSHHGLYVLSTLGFSQENFDVIADGIVESITRAHENMTLGRIRFNEGDLLGASVNRSPLAYLNNPSFERAHYPSDLDYTSTVLRFDSLSGQELGLMNRFPVHPTSINASNRLISADNKGHAAMLFERLKGTNYFDRKTFVAAFGNAHGGDASPATAAADLTGDNDWDCHLADDRACNELIGRMQFEKALHLYENATEGVAGPIDFRHRFVDMSRTRIEDEFNGGKTAATTCRGAIGISMLAGAEDHRGIGEEGKSCSGGGLGVRLMCRRDPCHGEKPVAVMMGRQNPVWSPQEMPVQILRIGQVALVALPGEFTTMSGRRIRNTVAKVFQDTDIEHVVLVGYANAYAGYVATREEYQLQHYEGASTHFGEWTQKAYEQEFKRIAVSLRDQTLLTSGAPVADARKIKPTLKAKLTQDYDATPGGVKLGSVAKDVGKTYRSGETARAQFWGGYPNNHRMTGKSFLEIQRQGPQGWEVVAHDWDEETRFLWARSGSRSSRITIEWDIPSEAEGTFRIRHLGYGKQRNGKLYPYEGYSSEFTVN